MQADDPPFLPVGTDVSAKYKGAFCEAKIKKVVRNIKCKVTFKGAGGGSVTVLDDAIKGMLRVGNTVEVKSDKKEFLEAIITKIQDCSQYTVVFDDGDITTLRRSALCLKSGRHFAESETLDQLPLTHPEHFGNPVIGSSGRRGRRTNRAQSDDSDSEASEWAGASGGVTTGPGNTITEREPHAGRVVLVQCSTGDKKRAHHSHQWFPGLVVAPNAQDTVKIKVKDDYLVRSFKDGRYYTVPKKEAREFRRNNASSEWSGVDAAILYLDKGVLPPHWDRDILFGQESQSQSDEIESEDSMDDEPHEEKDHFVAQLYKFMDDRGTPLPTNRQLTIANKDIDLYRLFNVVQKLGGYNKVTNQNQWKSISIKLGFFPASSSVTNLCKAYKKFLHSFEDFYRKLGVTLLSHPRGGRTTGRSLIRDKDKMHSGTNQKSASPAPPTNTNATEEKLSDNNGKGTAVKTKDTDKDHKNKEKESKGKESDSKEKETKSVSKEKDVKDKDVKEKENKDTKINEKDKEPKVKEKVKDVKEKEVKEKDTPKEKVKETVKVKQKDVKVKVESVNSSEEDSGDNQPLAPLSIKSEKTELTIAEKLPEKSKIQETPKSKLFKSASGTIDVKKSEKSSAKKITHRRNSLPRCAPNNKSDNQTSIKVESRCKSSSSDSSTTNKKQSSDTDKARDKDSSGSLSTGKKQTSSSEKNDSDSSSRGSKNGKTPLRRNLTSSNDITPPQTPANSSTHQQSSKKPRKRKLAEAMDVTQIITADVGDKLKVYYGPTHSESKVTYEAKVIEISGKGVDALLRVHYTGWNTRYDEWIKPSRIADNLSQNSKNKHKDKAKKSGPSESSGAKKGRSQSSTPSTKPHTRNRSGSNNTTASNQLTTDTSVHSESDSDLESDSSGQTKKPPEDKAPPVDKVVSDSSPVVENKLPESIKEKTVKTPKITKTPQVKRAAESSQSRIKRTRVKQEESQSPRGRDYDLNEIRSELKGLDNTLKTPSKETIKMDITVPTHKEDVKMTFKQEKTPDKVTEDIYEFKEPEPFEFEARKSEEKKKRTTSHRIFDDIPQLKLSPTASPDKPVTTITQEPEKVPPKSQFDVFDKLCQPDNYQVVEDSSNNSGEKEGEALSLFSEIGGEDSADRLMMSEADDSQEPLFTYQQPELFPDKSFIPMFKNFTPAKNQETYSKKDAANKLRDIEDDFTNSPIKGEQSSDEDPIDAAIQRVNAHSMSDDSNDGDLLIKTPATPTVPSGGLLSSFATETVTEVSNIDNANVDKNDLMNENKLEVLLKLKADISNINVNKLEVGNLKKEQSSLQDQSSSKITSIMEVDELLDSKKETDITTSFNDVIMPEPPVGFLIHKEGISIAEQVLKKIAKKALNVQNLKEPKITKIEPPKTLNIACAKNLPAKSPEPVEIVIEMNQTQEKMIDADIMPQNETVKVDNKCETYKKESPVLTVVEIVQKTSESTYTKPEISASILVNKKETVERRKSVAESTLCGKSNKVLSETIQKLSSQISQPIPTLPLSEYQTDDRSDLTDSDDSDSRLIIDKLSEEESQTGLSLPESSVSQPIKAQPEKQPSAHWGNVESHSDVDFEKSHNMPDTSTAVKEGINKQLEEDSNISLLLCEETIPGSPAPENLGEAMKTSKPRSTRNLDIPLVPTPGVCQDQAPKEHAAPKDIPRERDVVREREREREAGVMLRNDRDCIRGGNNADTVLDNTPPITPDSSEGDVSPSRDQQLSDIENNCDIKMNDEENRIPASSKMSNEIEKSSSVNIIRTSAPNSPGAGPRRGRRPRGCRFSDSEDQTSMSYSHSNTHRQMKYNFYSDIDPLLDGAARIALITSRLSKLRKVYHDLKLELATIDRRRKKLRRKEREAVKAAKAACS